MDRGRFRVAEVIVNRPLGNKKLADLFRRVTGLYGYYGSMKLACFVLSRRVSAFLSGAGGRRFGATIADICSIQNIPCVRVDKVNSRENLERIKALKPDWLVSIAASEKFREELLGLPTYGAINIHSGKLPKYRGMMPTFWQVLNGEKKITVTVHHMSEKFDEGNIVAEQDMPLENGERLHELIIRSKKVGGVFLARTLEILHANPTQYMVQSGESGYFSFPGISDVRQFQVMGHRVI